ncbi:hypothetical protein BE221DRAFT_190521 [Ostreococcus tauri]|uniref:Uncharacterized protein n=1 Tax=Ostreococcus tauri TaxID=70448 RepID=A0A1Y5IEZ3_OSTTA|nr:hypothetical protein BE221DRAFT_190521 [Ostreococcus tauri]
MGAVAAVAVVVVAAGALRCFTPAMAKIASPRLNSTPVEVPRPMNAGAVASAYPRSRVHATLPPMTFLPPSSLFNARSRSDSSSESLRITTSASISLALARAPAFARAPFEYSSDASDSSTSNKESSIRLPPPDPLATFRTSRPFSFSPSLPSSIVSSSLVIESSLDASSSSASSSSSLRART